ncbi:MAG: chromosome partitioning protein ParB, partial [Deltaproteobacteria bacterium]|nr:chromosome partitioning protein ParB [Deltaproteobacteria bacterium]
MMVLEFHQLDLRYAEIRSGDAKKEKRLLASLAEHGQQAPVIVVRGE